MPFLHLLLSLFAQPPFRFPLSSFLFFSSEEDLTPHRGNYDAQAIAAITVEGFVFVAAAALLGWYQSLLREIKGDSEVGSENMRLDSWYKRVGRLRRRPSLVPGSWV